jgi:hypothetical protein
VSLDRVLAIIGIAIGAGGIGIAILAPTARPIGWISIAVGVGALIAIPVLNFVARRRALPPPPRPKTLLDLFKQDFDYTLRHTRELKVQLENDGPQTNVLGQVYFDGGANSKFVGFFVPHSENVFSVCAALAVCTNEMLQSMNQDVLVEMGHIGQSQRTSMKGATFSGQVIIYHQGHFSAREQADLEELYKRHGLTLVLRGPSYAAVQAIGAAQASRSR